jgi:hypothetical protein
MQAARPVLRDPLHHMDRPPGLAREQTWLKIRLHLALKAQRRASGGNRNQTIAGISITSMIMGGFGFADWLLAPRIPALGQAATLFSQRHK